jgi:hypothetical protein
MPWRFGVAGVGARTPAAVPAPRPLELALLDHDVHEAGQRACGARRLAVGALPFSRVMVEADRRALLRQLLERQQAVEQVLRGVFRMAGQKRGQRVDHHKVERFLAAHVSRSAIRENHWAVVGRAPLERNANSGSTGWASAFMGVTFCARVAFLCNKGRVWFAQHFAQKRAGAVTVRRVSYAAGHLATGRPDVLRGPRRRAHTSAAAAKGHMRGESFRTRWRSQRPGSGGRL